MGPGMFAPCRAFVSSSLLFRYPITGFIAASAQPPRCGTRPLWPRRARRGCVGAHLFFPGILIAGFKTLIYFFFCLHRKSELKKKKKKEEYNYPGTPAFLLQAPGDLFLSARI